MSLQLFFNIFPDLTHFCQLFQKTPQSSNQHQSENPKPNDLMTMIEIFDGFQTFISFYRPIFLNFSKTFPWLITGTCFNNLFENKEIARCTKYLVSFFLIPSQHFLPLVVCDIVDSYFLRPFHEFIKHKHTEPTQNEVRNKIIGFMIPPALLLAYGYHVISLDMTFNISRRISFFSKD